VASEEHWNLDTIPFLEWIGLILVWFLPIDLDFRRGSQGVIAISQVRDYGILIIHTGIPIHTKINITLWARAPSTNTEFLLMDLINPPWLFSLLNPQEA
jgi:hypothetical protein